MVIPYRTAKLNPPIFLQWRFRAQLPNLIPANISGYTVGRSVKIHLYWAMKNCSDSPSKLQELIMNIPCHYQVHLHIHWGEPNPTTDLAYHHNHTIMSVLTIVYMCTHRASTPNAHLSLLATHQATHRVRSSWTMRRPLRAYTNS